MRVVISVTNDLTTDQRAHKTATSLTNNNYDVILIGRKLKNSISINRDYKTKRIKLFFYKGPLFYITYNIRLFFILLFIKADIFLACDLDSILANFIASKIRRKKIIYDSHEYFTEVPELKNRKITRSIWLSIEKIILPRLKNAYTVSESIAIEYNKKYKTQFSVIKNYPLKKKLFKSENPFPKDKKIIIYQGALNISRGLENAILSMKYIENALFYIIGDGDIKNELIDLSQKNKLNNKVIFIGKVPLEKLYNYTIYADLGVSLEESTNLNYYYSLPNKIFDYIQANVPILASDLPEIRMLINSNNIGKTISDMSPESISLAINEILNDKDQIKIWKKNLHKIEEKYTWENQEKELLKKFN